MLGTQSGSCKVLLKMLLAWRLLWTALVMLPLTVLAALLCFLFGLFGLLRGNFPGRGDRFVWASRVRHLWGLAATRLMGIRIEVRGPGLADLHSDSGAGYIVVSNHQSALDILALAVALPNNSFFFAKKELLFVPFLGWGAAFANTIYIDRKKGIRDERPLRYVDKLLRRGDNLIIFPEGTRSRGKQMKTFKRGAFVMAINLKKDVLPVCIENSYELMGSSNLYFKQGVLRVWVGRPVSTKNYGPDDRFRLAEELQSLISKNLDQST